MNKVICRLCLKIFEGSEFELLENVRFMLNFVSLKLNLQVSEEPLVCIDCKQKLEECFNFKIMCTSTEESLVSYEKTDNNEKLSFEDNNVCRFCLKLTKCNNSSKIQSYDQFFARYMPKVELKATSAEVICDSCLISLENYAKFVETCFEQETIIENYQKSTETPDGHSIDLLRVLEYSLGNGITEIKQEISEEEKLLFENSMPRTEVCLNSVNNIIVDECMNMDENTNEQKSIKNVLVCSRIKTEPADAKLKCESKSAIFDEEINGGTDHYHVSVGEKEDKCKLEIMELDQQSECSEPGLQNETYVEDIECDVPEETVLFNCNICGTTQTRSKHDLKIHLCYNKDPSGRGVYRCEICSYVANGRSKVKKHMNKHMDASKMLKCPDCEFKTRHKSSLTDHMMSHKDPSEIPMFKCQVCNYETRHKNSLRRHLAIHSTTDVAIYKCEICPFETMRNSQLKKHMIVHKDPSTIEIFRCDLCAFETIHKRSLDVHRFTHNKNDGETPTYKCEHCDYKTNRECYVKKHMLIHDLPGTKFYLCEICGFKSKLISYLNIHRLKHDNSSRTRKYLCDQCDYQAKQKNHLITHMITHKKASEVEIFMCDVCQFRTKYKHIIRNHMGRHRNRVRQ